MTYTCIPELRLCGVKCSKQCPHGFKMTVFGCPDPTCECRDICKGVQVVHVFSTKHALHKGVLT
ncbi:antistasin family protein [Ancylostoma caninum]|uniref:Antistasin family protein n=1 Tax=Ancylostoma caninum TaxID=29170 RepID=A0A368F7A8_ANCCA|nr:antistasin family protein [Ancylostoma caninum]